MPDTAPAKRVLFICRLNRHRSATAERIFCKRTDLDVRSAGTEEDALVRVNAHMLDWAEVIFTMDDLQLESLQRMFPSHPALDRVICLGIEDAYVFLEPRLIQMLQDKVREHLGIADC